MGFGVIFRMSPTGSLSVVHEFDGTDGETPYAGLVRASNGIHYGTTSAGGTRNAGTIYSLSPSGDRPSHPIC
jgi:uncharacterized repeat protein (TIGR03803 family)